MKRLKTTQKVATASTNIDQIKSNNPPRQNFKKWKLRLCNGLRPAGKHRLTLSNKLRRRHHEIVIQLRKTTENTTGLQSDPARHVN